MLTYVNAVHRLAQGAGNAPALSSSSPAQIRTKEDVESLRAESTRLQLK